ncbi:MAG: prepilin-type N-terminal cleavage/methylation domain-containing protein [Candidatus Omnitrophota bacterium]|nr:prepilin-type N-terminal cleavage/methylation domain-containing protein [Candidatus Omnitrophota bacterium]
MKKNKIFINKFEPFLQCRYSSMKRRAGFTLIEGLIVLAILGLLIGTLYIVFNTGLASWKKSEARLEIYQNSRSALEIMTREISAAIINPTAPNPPGANSIYFLGYNAPSGLRANNIGGEIYFVGPGNADNTNGKSDLCEMGYWLYKGDENVTNSTNDPRYYVLMRYYVTDDRSEPPNPTPPPVHDFDYDSPPASGNIFSTGSSDQVVARISSVTFEYFDGTTWQPTWSSRTGGAQAGTLPKAVRITLVAQENAPTGGGITPQSKTFQNIAYLQNIRY